MSFFEIDAATTALKVLRLIMQLPILLFVVVYLIIILPVAFVADGIERIRDRRLISFREFMDRCHTLLFIPVEVYHNWSVRITTTKKQRLWDELRAVNKEKEKDNE